MYYVDITCILLFCVSYLQFFRHFFFLKKGTEARCFAPWGKLKMNVKNMYHFYRRRLCNKQCT